MHIKQARVINVFWAPGETVDLHAMATALRDLPPDARAYFIETTQDGDASSTPSTKPPNIGVSSRNARAWTR